MKKALALLLTLIMIVGLVPLGTITAFAASPATIKVESVSAIPGSTVDVAISITDNPGIASMGFTLTFDDALTLVGAANGEALSELTLTPPAQLKKTGSVTGSCRFAWLGTDNVTENGNILNLKFKVADDAETNKDCLISITCENGDVLDDSRATVDVITQNGKITIINYTPGDVDGNTTINMLDVLTLCQFYVDGCKYDPNGYGVNINSECGDVDANGKVNMLDVLMICQYYVDGCQYDPNGYGVKLLPGKKACEHSMQHFTAKDATCTEDGNIEYWYCTKCNDYFADMNGNDSITLAYTVIKAKGHTIVVDEAVAPTEDAEGLTEGSHCSVCGFVAIKQEPIAIPLPKERSIQYNIVNEAKHPYLATLQIDASMLDYVYTPGTALTLKNLELGKYGYTFDGWFDGFGDSASQIKEIPDISKENIVLYAHVTETIYDITYNTYQTPVKSSPEDSQLQYTVSKGNFNLYNPEINNYKFLGWYDNNGVEFKKIPIGHIGHITLNAYYTSLRNLAVAAEDNNPIVIEDTNEGVVYFTYEIGEIRHVPIKQIGDTIQSVAGLKQVKVETVNTSIQQGEADSVSNTISNMAAKSQTWTLSENWNDVTTVNESWAESIGKTSSAAKTDATTSSGTLSLTSQNGGSEYHKTEDGTTVYNYDSKTTTKDKGHTFNASLSGNIGNKVEANMGNVTENGTNKNTKSGLTSHSNKDTASSGVSVNSGWEVNAGLEYGYHNTTNTVTKTGSDSVDINSEIDENTSTWNNSATFSATNSHSTSSTVTNTLSDIITTTKNYGSSYSKGGSDTETQGFSSSESNTSGSSSTLTWSKLDSTSTTNTYEVDGHIEGKYRQLLVGKAHVFGVVGYDYNTKSYFSYSFTVMDDETEIWLDYTPKDGDFHDCENSCVPFNIPIDIFEYVNGKTAKTKGVTYITDSVNGTARILNYVGTEKDVIIPTYVSDGTQFYKVTEISQNAFAGKDIENVSFGDYIVSIPNGAFKNCTKLKGVIGKFTEIGDEAFSGCSSLVSINIPSNVTKIGIDAFKGANSITARVINDTVASEMAKAQLPNGTEQEIFARAKEITENNIKSIINSGANNIKLDISYAIEGARFDLDIGEIDSITISGGKKTYNDFSIKSMAKETSLSEMTIINNSKMPLNIGSDSLSLYKVYVSANNVALLMRKDRAKLLLIQDSIINTNGANAIISKNLVIDPQTTESGAVGFLNVKGNLRYVNTVTGSDYTSVSDGEVLEMSDDEFQKYLLGQYTLTFDYCGAANADVPTKQVYYGIEYGTLPTPSRDYYTFVGWFTEETGGENVTAQSVFDSGNDITLYAHWAENPLSDWVKATDMPSNAQDVNAKWTLDVVDTTKSASTVKASDWELTNTTSKWGEYGSWSSWSSTKPAASDSRQVDSPKTVTDRAAYTNYRYWIYRSSDGYGYGTQNYYTSCGACTRYDEINITYALPVYDSSLGTYGPYNSSMFSHGYDCYWFSGGSSYVPAVTHTEYRYRDRSLLYTYCFEATVDPTGNANASNVVKYVQYRLK